MKKLLVILVLLSAFGSNNGFSQTLTIDNAIETAVNDIRQGVPGGTKIAVINIDTEFTDIADYAVNELIVRLVNTHLFRVVPRSEVELTAARTELNFQYSGDVSEESQKKLGAFLGAGTIITGSFSKDSKNSYRLIVHTIDVESFTYQSSFRVSIQNDTKMRRLLTGGGRNVYEDYTFGERIGTGTINILFGLGSALQGDKKWWIGGTAEGLGVILLTIGLIYTPRLKSHHLIGDQYRYDYDKFYEDTAFDDAMTIGGIALIGTGIIIGYVIPFFYHKSQNSRVSLIDWEKLNIELVSDEKNSIAGLKIGYILRF